VEVVFSPIIDVKEYPECVDVCLVEGAVCNRDNLEQLLKVRRRTRSSYPSAIVRLTGNVSAIRNQLGLGNAENVLQWAYIDNARTTAAAQGRGNRPGTPEAGPARARVVAVEAYLPGCPPSAQKIRAVFERILAGLPPHWRANS